MISQTPWARPLRRGLTFAAALITAATLTLTTGCEDDAGEVDIESRAAVLQPIAFQQESEREQRTAETEGEVTIRKTVPDEIVMGQTMSYTIRMQNTSGGDLRGLIIREELPEGFQFESSEPQPTSQEGRLLTYRFGNIADEAAGEIRITGTPQQMGDLQACTTYELDRGVCAAFTVVNPSLRLTKAGPEMASVCTPVEYVYTLTNDGDTAAEGVTLYDQLPEGMMLAEGDGRTLEQEIGTIEPGQTVERRVAVKASEPREFQSYAVANSELIEVKSKPVATTFVAPDIRLNVNAGSPVTYIGESARFEVRVTNNGDVPADRVLLASAVEGGQVTRVYGARNEEGQVQAGGIEPGEGGEAVIGTLQPGDSRTLFVDVVAEEPGPIELGAVAQAVCRDSGTELARAEDTAQLQVRAVAALQLEVVDSQDPVQIGQETAYEVTVINEGQAPDTNVRVTAELPEGLSFVRAEGDTEVSADGRSITMAPVETLEAGQSATWYVFATAEQGAGGQKFSVQLESENTDASIQEDEPTRLYGGGQASQDNQARQASQRNQGSQGSQGNQ